MDTTEDRYGARAAHSPAAANTSLHDAAAPSGPGIADSATVTAFTPSGTSTVPVTRVHPVAPAGTASDASTVPGTWVGGGVGVHRGWPSRAVQLVPPQPAGDVSPLLTRPSPACACWHPCHVVTPYVVPSAVVTLPSLLWLRHTPEGRT